jgi:hypothetical protein
MVDCKHYLWGLMYAFIGKKEQAKEEETLGKSWEIARIL